LLGTDHVTWRGEGLWFFVSFRIFVFRTRDLEFFFPEFNIRFYDKNSESDFFSSTKIRMFFSATLGIRIFFLEKKHNPSPLQVKWLFPYNVPRTAIYNCIYLINLYNKKQTKLWDTIATNIGHELFYFANTVKPANTVISIKQSPVLRGHIFIVLL
jgi:hypothetical protein